MKMSEIDHTNSLGPAQAQQNVCRPEGERSVRFKKCSGQKRLLSMQSVKTKTFLYLEHGDTCWV